MAATSTWIEFLDFLQPIISHVQYGYAISVNEYEVPSPDSQAASFQGDLFRADLVLMVTPHIQRIIAGGASQYKDIVLSV